MTRTELESVSPGDTIILPDHDDEYPIIEAGQWFGKNWRWIAYRVGTIGIGQAIAADGPEFLGKRISS